MRNFSTLIHFMAIFVSCAWYSLSKCTLKCADDLMPTKNEMRGEKVIGNCIRMITYPLKPLRLLMGEAVVAAEFSVDNVRSVNEWQEGKKHRVKIDVRLSVFHMQRVFVNCKCTLPILSFVETEIEKLITKIVFR